jgi:chromate reductase
MNNMDEKYSLNVLAFAGSLRKESYNRKALRIAIDIARNLGATVHEIDLKVLALPVFDADLRENGFPDSVQAWKREIEASDMLLIATPEHNHSVPGPLKNAIDWASDKTNPFEGKVAAIIGASTGLVGTVRAQIHLRQILGSLEVQTLSQPQVLIRTARTAFNPDGSFADAHLHRQIEALIQKTMKLTMQLKQEHSSVHDS